MRRFAFSLVAGVSASALLGGCGGGSSHPGGVDPGSVHKTILGEGTITYFGQAAPAQTFTQNGVSIAAMAGATFSNVTLTPSQTLANSIITYVQGAQLWVSQNGVNTEITHLVSNNVQNPQPSHTGQIVFVANDLSNHVQLYTCNFDGSALKKITSGALQYAAPSWSPSGSKIAFYDSNTFELYTINSNGTSLVDLNTKGLFPKWSPDGSKIAFSYTISPSTHSQIYSMPAAGGSPTQVSANFGSDDCYYPCWSPDGTQMLFTGISASSRVSIFAEDATGGLASSGITNPPSSVGDLYPSFAPDGNTLTFARILEGTSNAIEVAPYAYDSALTNVATTASTEGCTQPAWSPYFGKKTFIGTGGLFASASGFVWSELNGFSSFLAFTATTPSTATITSQNLNSTSGSPILLLQADHVTKINYTNSYYGAIQTISPGTTQVLVSFNATTGAVETLAPFAASAVNAAVKPALASGRLVYAGQFPAVYSKGKNVALNGACQVEIDSKTGALVGWK